ncbi:MAG TPA: CehA/McbA family metallohydrolase [Anaerolineales bacterium]|nr:CehA/McbA family metallohydrolase [Anaerolineales bacterium]
MESSTYELVINLHMHTPYSDGSGSHAEIARAALRAGLDAVIVTDHNVWVNGPQGYYQEGDRRTLLLVGEEVHNRTLQPQKNHLLVFGAYKEMAGYAEDLQRLIDAVRTAGGLAFIAHPVDPAAPTFREVDISWEDWSVQRFTGLELWNGMSEFKGRLKSWLHGLYYAFNPRQIAHGPFPQAIQRWDSLLAEKKKVVAVGGSDAHELHYRIGPFHKVLFPYEFHFKAINTHLLADEPLSGEALEDSTLILETLRKGRVFIGYDLPASTRGFRFSAQGSEGTAQMGDQLTAKGGVTFQIRLPMRTECRLIKDGSPIKTWQQNELCTHIATEPGVYRVEVYIQFAGRRRTWIISNPIYVVK